MHSFCSDFSLSLSELYVCKSEPGGDLRISFKTARCLCSLVPWFRREGKGRCLSSSSEERCLTKVGTLVPGLLEFAHRHGKMTLMFLLTYFRYCKKILHGITR